MIIQKTIAYCRFFMFKPVGIAEKLGYSVIFFSQLMPIVEIKLMLFLIPLLISHRFSFSCWTNETDSFNLSNCCRDITSHKIYWSQINQRRYIECFFSNLWKTGGVKIDSKVYSFLISTLVQ